MTDVDLTEIVFYLYLGTFILALIIVGVIQWVT